MVFTPRDEDTIFTDLRGRLEGKISGLTNWASNSFNNLWVGAFSRGLRENEIQAVAAQLSGWIEYAGGPVTESDLEDLGLADVVTPEEVNEYMDDEDLDELVKMVGIQRFEGARATGDVEITLSTSSATFPSDATFSTQPDENGNILEFEIVDSDGDPIENSVTYNDGDPVPVRAVERGEVYNVGATQVSYMPNPPSGLQAVSNPKDMEGGANAETNDELRARAKEAVFSTSGGGTENGIVGFLEQPPDEEQLDEYNLDITLPLGVNDVLIEEFTSQQPPYVDVIVDGGDDADVDEVIQFAKPVGIKHNLVRPTGYRLKILSDVTGSDIDTSRIESDIIDYLDELDIGEDFYRDKIYQVIFNSDENVENTTSLQVLIIGEVHTFSTGTDIYPLDKGAQMEQSNNVDEVRGTLNGTSGHVFVEDTDYQVIDNSGGGDLDAVDWSLAGDDPDDGTDFFVDYEVADDVPFSVREKAEGESATITVV